MGIATVLFWPAQSAAQSAPARASLVVTRGEGADDCPDAASLAEQVQRLAGSSVIGAQPLSATPSETWIQVAIVRNFAGYRAEIHEGGRHHGNRLIEDLGPSCASLADAISIAIAIFLDPYAPAPTRAVQSAPPAIPAPLTLSARPDTPRPASPWRSRLTLDLAGGASFGALAQTAPLMSGRLAWRATERWSLGLGGAFLFPESLSNGSRSVDLGLSYGYLIGCARTAGEAEGVRLDWCATALLGSLYGRGRGYEDNWLKRAPWMAIAAGPELVLPFAASFAWSVSGLAALPLTRPSFAVESAGKPSDAFRSPAVAALVTIGVRGEL